MTKKMFNRYVVLLKLYNTVNQLYLKEKEGEGIKKINK